MERTHRTQPVPRTLLAGLRSRLTRLFAPGSNPILGKWHASFARVAAATFAFLPDELRTGGGGHEVRYETHGDQVIAHEIAQGASLLVRIVGPDTGAKPTPGGELRATRIELEYRDAHSRNLP